MTPLSHVFVFFSQLVRRSPAMQKISTKTDQKSHSFFYLNILVSCSLALGAASAWAISSACFKLVDATKPASISKTVQGAYDYLIHETPENLINDVFKNASTTLRAKIIESAVEIDHVGYITPAGAPPEVFQESFSREGFQPERNFPSVIVSKELEKKNRSCPKYRLKFTFFAGKLLMGDRLV